MNKNAVLNCLFFISNCIV